MIALAIGGCFCNDLRYVAAAMGIELHAIQVDVGLELDGTPLLVTSATMTVHVTAADGIDVAGTHIDTVQLH